MQRCNTPSDAPDPASGSIARRISTAVAVEGSPRHGHDLARPRGRLSTRSDSGSPGASGGAATEDEGRDGGGGEGTGGKLRSAAVAATTATAEFVLASLTRLDLNNNILHNLDDLKVSRRTAVLLHTGVRVFFLKLH